MNITQWLISLEKTWKDHDVAGVLSLFAEDLEYFESPQEKLTSREELREVWEVIRGQDIHVLHFELFASAGRRSAVCWELQYYTEEEGQCSYAGTYLIELNSEGKCCFFYQTCEEVEKITPVR